MLACAWPYKVNEFPISILDFPILCPLRLWFSPLLYLWVFIISYPAQTFSQRREYKDNEIRCCSVPCPPPSVPGLHLAWPEVVDTRRCGNRPQHGSSHNPRNSERYCSNLLQYISFWQYIFFRNHLPWKKRYVILLVSRKKDLRSVWKVLTIKLREWESRQKELLWTETKEARQANSISLISYVKLFVNVLFQLQTSIYCLYDCTYSGVSVDSCSQFQ